MCRAIKSLPTPLSPVTSTLPSLAAARSARCIKPVITGLATIMGGVPASAPAAMTERETSVSMSKQTNLPSMKLEDENEAALAG